MNYGTIAVFTAVAACIGCGSGGERADWGDESNLQTVEQAIGDYCGTLTPSVHYTYVMPWPAAQSEPPHATPGCTRGYVIQLDQALTDAGLYHEFAYDGPEPTTQDACEASWLVVYRFKRSSGTWVKDGDTLDKFGVWSAGAGRCIAPHYTVNYTTQRDHRYAVSSRPVKNSTTVYPTSFGTYSY